MIRDTIEKYGKWVLIALPLIILFFLFSFRLMHDGTMFGNLAYYHLHAAKIIHENPSLIFSNLYARDLNINLFDVILSIFPNEFFAQFLSLAFSLASAYLLYKMVRKTYPEKSFYFLFILFLSPPFIYMAAFVNSECLALFITLVSIYLFMEGEFAYAVVCSAFLIAFYPLNILILIFALFFLRKKMDSKKYGLRYNVFFAYLFFLFFASLFVSDAFYFNYELENMFSDFGAQFGLSLVFLIFALMALAIDWRESRWMALFSFLTFILSFDYPQINLYTNLFVVYFASTSFFYLVHRRWSDKIVKNITFLVIASTILFSTLSYINLVKDSAPKGQTYDAVLSIPVSGTDYVLATKDKSMILQANSLRPFIPVFGNEVAENISEEIFLSKNLDKTRKLLETNGIQYIVVDDSLSTRLNENNEGILFLLKNNKLFTRIYFNEKISVWQYKKLVP